MGLDVTRHLRYFVVGQPSAGEGVQDGDEEGPGAQAPEGELNENSRGSISGMVKPETGQANFSEKMIRPGGV